MKKYLISLDKDQQRREVFFRQAETQDFEVFSAMNTMQETWEKLTALFALDRFQQRYGREVTKGEIGCTLSHLGVYQKIVAETEISEQTYCLVCEDDALFNDRFSHHLQTLLQQESQADIILIGQSKIATFDDVELEITYPTTFSFCCKHLGESEFRYAYPYRNYFAGTVAYLIKKSAARRILQAIQQATPYWLADDFSLFGQQFQLEIMVLRPLLAIENPTLVSNLEAVRGSSQHPLWKKLLKYPFKKCLAIQRNLGK